MRKHVYKSAKGEKSNDRQSLSQSIVFIMTLVSLSMIQLNGWIMALYESQSREIPFFEMQRMMPLLTILSFDIL